MTEQSSSNQHLESTAERQLPLDFRWQYILLVYVGLLALVWYFGEAIGAYPPIMGGCLVVGFLAGLPAAKWELEAILKNWNGVMEGPIMNFRLNYYKEPSARKRTQYALGASFLIPLIFLALAFFFYYREILKPVSFGWSLLLLIKWNGWYWLPYIVGLEFATTHLPRMVAANARKKKNIEKSGDNHE